MTPTLRNLLVAVWALATLGGCMRPQAFRLDESLPSKPQLIADWSVQLYKLMPMAYQPTEIAVPLLHGEVLVVGGRDGILRGFDARTGTVLWRLETGDPIVARPVSFGDDVIVGSMSGILYRVQAKTGTVLWNYDVESSIISPVSAENGRVFAVNNRNSLFALDVETGKYLWHKNRPHKTAFTMNGQGAPLATGGKVFAGFSDGVVVCLAQEDGATLWTRALGGSDGRFVDVDSDPVLHKGILYVASFNGGLHALDAASGEGKWKRDESGYSTPFLAGNRMVVTRTDGVVMALRLEDGHALWTTRLDGEDKFPGSPVLRAGTAFVSDGKGLVVLDVERGKVRGRWSTGDGIAAVPAATPLGVFLVSNGGVLYRFRTQGG